MKPENAQSLERILESAIIAYWPDLMHGTQTGLIHIEYGFAAGGTLDYPKGLVIREPRPLASGLSVLDVTFYISRHRRPLR